MDSKTESDIRAHAVAEFPKEACGVVVVAKGKERYVACRNIADDPLTNFVMDAEDMANAEDMGSIVAVAHSHPNAAAVMSVSDRVQCANGDLPWYIVAVHADEDSGDIVAGDMNRYEPDGYQAPLVGRPFVHGILDCYTLVRDWYFRERDVTLPNYERHDNWWHNGQDLYMDLFADAGFEPITGQIETGDVIIMQVRAPKANHAGVYIGDGIMLHHLSGRLSTREVYGGSYLEMTRIIVRYKGGNHA